MPTAFGTELRRLRELHRLSRAKLGRLSGVSESQIGNIEVQDAEAFRTTVIDLATAVPEWDVNDALRLAGYEPLNADEQAALTKRGDPRSHLDRLWGDLTPIQQAALVAVARAFVNPQATAGHEGTAAIDYWPGNNDREPNGAEQEPAES